MDVDELAVSRVCRICSRSRPLTAYLLCPGGARRRVCSTCRHARERQANPERVLRSQREKRQRLRASALLSDCRSSDKKKGLIGNDLDRDFVAGLISLPCSYCESTALQMTLDRIDNSLAHVRGNVVPCCLRCNYIRGSMPYEAWLEFTPTLKSVVAKGLFGDWRSRPLNLKEGLLPRELRGKRQ